MENIEILLIMSGITFLYYLKKEHENKCETVNKKSKYSSNKKSNSSKNHKEFDSEREKTYSKFNDKDNNNETEKLLNKKVKEYNDMKYIINSIKRLNK